MAVLTEKKIIGCNIFGCNHIDVSGETGGRTGGRTDRRASGRADG